MLSLETIETKIKEALKAKDPVAADTLRGLKVRLQNEKISKMRDLSEEEIISLVKSEIKRRKEAAESFTAGGRADSAEKELREASILEQFMPAQMSEQEITEVIGSVLAGGAFNAADFGKAMGQVKARVGQNADGAVVARILKEKLK